LHLQAAHADLPDDSRSPLDAELRDWAVREAEQSKWRTVGVHAGVLGIGYNADVLAKRHLPEPKCWTDLARPEYDGDVQLANPHVSGAGFSMLATFVQIFGEDKGFALLKAVRANAGIESRTNAGPIRSAARGETAIAITFLHDGVTEIANGFPIRLVAPCEGTGFEAGSMSIIKGAPNAASARRFYDWALTPAAPRIGADPRHYETPSNRDAPAAPLAPNVGDVRLVAYDFAKYASAAERTRLLDRWDRDVHPSSR
jgi:iron(III) transport system substrate-binding protein